MKKYLALLLTVVLTFALAACGGGDTSLEKETPLTKEKMQETAEMVTIDRLSKDFEDNIVAAKEKYSGKMFYIPGCVSDIQEDGCVLFPGAGSYACLVKANLPADELKLLNKGDLIRVVGTIADEVEADRYIQLQNAHFVDEITEVSGTAYTDYIGDYLGFYIDAPFLTEDVAIYLYNSSLSQPIVETIEEGDKVTISAADIERRELGSRYWWEIGCNAENTKVEKATQ